MDFVSGKVMAPGVEAATACVTLLAAAWCATGIIREPEDRSCVGFDMMRIIDAFAHHLISAADAQDVSSALALFPEPQVKFGALASIPGRRRCSCCPARSQHRIAGGPGAESTEHGSDAGSPCDWKHEEIE